MGLRCLLGHDFDEPELQREREEDGDEVVTTVKEVKTCARCGETQIVSENTEVTTMEQLADEAAANAAGKAGPAGGDDRGATAGPATGPENGPGHREASGVAGSAGVGSTAGHVDADDAATAEETSTLDEEPGAETDDAVILDDEPAADEGGAVDVGASPSGVDAPADRADGPNDAGESDSVGGSNPADEDTELLDAGEGSPSGVSAGPDAAPESASADETDAESDDGVILDEDDADDAGDRERGAWPAVDEDDAGAGGSAAWPDHGGEDEGFSAEVGEGGDADVEFGGGLTPEAAEQREEEGTEETEYVEAPDDAEAVAFDDAGEGGTGITRSETPDLETVGGNEPTEYYCPECGMVRAADGSSMRAGDICPECKRGYVDERPQESG